MPGSSSIGTLEVHNRVSTLEESLLRLKEEKQAAETVGDAPMVVDPNDDGQLIVTTNTVADDGAPTTGTQSSEAEELDDSAEFEEFSKSTPEAEITLNIQKANEISPGIVVKQGQSKDPVVVFIRHGRTPHNNLGLL